LTIRPDAGKPAILVKSDVSGACQRSSFRELRLGSLALAAVASGAFRTFLLRRVTLEDVARITAEQFVELARFVDQCSPDVLQQILSMLA
jgi:hypothetical protein